MIDNKDRVHAGRMLIVHDSQQLSIQSDLLEPQSAEVHAVESLLMVDRHYRYVSIDDAFCRLLGAQQEDLIGQPIGLRIGLDAYDEHIRPSIERAFAGEAAAVLLLTTHEVLGTLRLACACYPCLGLDGQIEYVLLRLRDNSARDKLHLASQRRKQRESALFALDSALNSEAKIEKIGALAVHSLLEVTGCYAVMVRQTLRDPALSHAATTEEVAALVAAATSNDAELKPGERIILPLQEQGIRLGELEIQLCDGKALRGEARAFVETVAGRLAEALFRASVQAEVQQYTASLERIVAERTREVTRRRHAAMGLQDILGKLIANQSLPAILDSIVRQAETMLGADAVAVLQAQSKESSITFAPLEIDDPYSNVMAADLSRAQAAIATAADQRRPVTGHLGEWVDNDEARYHTHLAVPMIVANEVVGVVIYFFMARRDLTSDEIETAAVLSEQVFFAVESDRLQQRAREGAAAQERERLARELHDAVAQSIYGLSLFVEAGRRHAASGQIERVEEYLQLLSETTQQTKKHASGG